MKDRGAVQLTCTVLVGPDVGFKLDTGGIGMSSFDPQKSPYGWHVIKRLQ